MDENAIDCPNAALGHATDALGDLDGFGVDQLDDVGRVAAADCDVILRDAMGEAIDPADLLDVARRCVAAALDGRSAAVGSLIVGTILPGRGMVDVDAPAVRDLVRALATDARRVR